MADNSKDSKILAYKDMINQLNKTISAHLIPLALKGVAYKPIGASALLRRNLLIYGVGGLIAPFVRLQQGLWWKREKAF